MKNKRNNKISLSRNSVTRANPMKGLPHEDESLAKVAQLYVRPYDKVRADLGITKEVKDLVDFEKDILKNLEDTQQLMKRKASVKEFEASVDYFKKHFECLADFKLDMEGFLQGLKARFPDEPYLKKVMPKYRAIYQKVCGLVDLWKSLKELD